VADRGDPQPGPDGAPTLDLAQFRDEEPLTTNTPPITIDTNRNRGGWSESTESILSAKDVSQYESSKVSQERCHVDSGHMHFCRGSNFQIGNHPATAQRERNHTRCIGKKLLAITNPFGASAQG
jgi:hypothetical protein